MYEYFKAIPTAGYSGFVNYYCGSQMTWWMVPGTFFDDWDNQ